MSITTKLLLSFLASLVLIAATATTALRISMQYERALDSLDREHLQGAVSLSSAMDALWRLRYGFPQFMVIGDEGRGQIVAEEPALYAKLERNLQHYEAGLRSVREKDSLQQLRQVLGRYILARPKWFELYGAGKLEEAAQWRARHTTPLGAATVAAFENQIALQQEVAQDNILLARQLADRSRAILYAVLAVLLLAGSATFILGIRMLRPLKRLRGDVEHAMRELFGESLEVEGRDEVEILSSSFQHMTQRFITHTRELTSTRQQLDRQREILEDTVVERTAELGILMANKEVQASEATLLYELGDRLQSCGTLDEASGVLQLFGPKLFPDHAGMLYITRPSRDLLEPAMCWDPERQLLPFHPQDCWALRRGKTHRVDSDREELVCAHVHHDVHFPYLCVPLGAQGETIGLLHLQSSKGEQADTSRAERLAHAAASQIGLAVGNLRLRETLRMQSLSDSLTGLYNRRFLDETLQREMARAQRAQLPLTVLMIDVDHFKNFNDSFGHEGGDMALRAVGRLMREHFRESDYGCRYGGEEFAVIMPDAPLVPARQRADALREAVTRLDLSLSGRAIGSITISVGLATMPQHGTTPQALIQAADAALYRAKQSGRNRVVVSGTDAVAGP